MKSVDLGFYKGIGQYPAEVYQSEFAKTLASATTNILYSYEGFDANNEFYNIDTTGGYSLFFGTKILNNNVLYGDPANAYLTPFIGAQYQITDGDIEIILSLPVTNISGQNSFSQITYSAVNLSTNVPAAAGNIDTGINGIRLREDINNDTNWYGAFPCVIFQSSVLTPETAINRAAINDPTIVIKDFDFIPDFTLPDRYYYFITTQNVYSCSVGDPATITLIPLPVPNFVNLTCLGSYQGNDAAYRDSIVVGGFDSDASEYRALYFDTVTGDVWQYKAIGSGGDYPINRIYYRQNVNAASGAVAGRWGVATDGGVFVLEYDTLDTTLTISDTAVASDCEVIYRGGANYNAAYTTNAGYFVYGINGSAVTYSFETSKSFTCISGRYNVGGDTFYCMAGANDYLYYTNLFYGSGNDTSYLVNNSDIPWNDICYVGINFTNPHIGLGATSGHGIVDLAFTDPPTADQIGTVYYLTYTLSFADIVKEDASIYYGLLQLIGCGAADTAAALFKLDYVNDIYEVGDLEGNVTTNKLWIADNFFILNNTIDTNSLYYKSLLNLDLAELTGTQEQLVGEDAGIFNTTEAGDVVDIIIDRSLFYILGTRAIEVWQNNGATGFPYRKQPYATAKYHNFPQALSVTVDNISRFTPYQAGYVIATIDNSQNKLDLLYIQNGSAKPFLYNKNGWLQIVNNYINTAIEDIHINTFKFYGEDYISLVFLDEDNEALGSALINGKGNVFFLSERATFYQYLQTVSETGILAIFTNSEISAQYYDYIHTTLNTALAFPYVMTSQLLRPMSTQVMVNKVVIQYNYAADVSGLIALPANSTYEVAYSVDGRSGTFLSFSRDFSLTERQIVVQINRQMPSFVLRFSSTLPIIIFNAFVIYDEAGIK